MWGEALGPRPEEGQLRYSIICTGFFFFSRSQLLSQDWSTFSSEVSLLATIAAAEDFNPSAAFPSTSTITFSLWFNIINQDHFTRITVPGRNIDVQRVSSLVLAQVPHVARGKPGKSITGSGWNKKEHLPKKTGSMREFKCSHICAFTPTTSLPSSAAFLQVKMKTTLMLLLVMLEANLATIIINMTEKAKILFSNLRQRAP